VLTIIPIVVSLILAFITLLLSLVLAPGIFFFFVANEVAHDRMPIFMLLFAFGIALFIIPLIIMAVRAAICGIKKLIDQNQSKSTKSTKSAKAEPTPPRHKQFILPSLACLGLACIIAAATISAVTRQPLWPALTGNFSFDRPEQPAVDNPIADITSITTNLSNGSLTVRADDDATEVTVRHHNLPHHMTIHTELVDGVLSVSQTYFYRWPRFNFLQIRSPHVEIIVPANSTLDYSLETRNGRITLTDLEATTLVATTSNGAVELHYVTADEVSVRTSNGRIVFTELTSKDIGLRTSNGRIEGTVYGHLHDFNTDFNTNNGNITVNGARRGTHFVFPTGDYPFQATTSNGRINITFLHGVDSGRLSYLLK